MSVGNRGVWSRKTRVDEARSIDILDLQREKVLSKGAGLIWTASWLRNDEMVASISYRAEVGEDGPSGLRFMYTITNNDTGEKKNYNYIIPVVSTPCNYGGKRWWYICPLIVNGLACRRRCRIVYMRPGSEYFGCRECHRLTYESRQRHREKFYEGFEKPRKTIETVEKRLARTKSLEQKVKLLRKYAQATKKIELFVDVFTNSKPKIIYSDK